LWLSIVCNQVLPVSLRRKFLIKLRATRNYSSVRLKNRCVISNRAKSVIRFFQLSRIVFRQLAREGVLVGVKRSSW
jgi:ribosomal protein S14